MTEKTKSQKASAKFDYKTIKSFEDACIKLGIDPEKLPDVSMLPEDLRKPVIASYKLMIIYQAINDGWKPDWSNYNQYKYFPWYGVLSSGFGFSDSDFHCGNTFTYVDSRLCTDSSEKAMYIAEQFKAEYQDYFLYSA